MRKIVFTTFKILTIIGLLIILITVTHSFRPKESVVVTEMSGEIVSEPIDIVTSNEVMETKELEVAEPINIGNATINETTTTTTYRVSAYCSCEICCGKWALNRPLDSNGLPIVNGASGDVLIKGVSVASPLPFGTKIALEDYGTVIVHDRTASEIVDKYGRNILDLYFNNHQEAKNWGVRYIEGVIVE